MNKIKYAVMGVLMVGFSVVNCLAGKNYGRTEFWADVTVENWVAISNVTSAVVNGGGIYTTGTNAFIYRVAGSNSAGRLPSSTNVAVTFVGSATGNAVKLTWERYQGLSKIVILRSTDAGTNFSFFRITQANPTTFTDTGLQVFNTNDFEVGALIPDPVVPWIESAIGFVTNNQTNVNFKTPFTFDSIRVAKVDTVVDGTSTNLNDYNDDLGHRQYPVVDSNKVAGIQSGATSNQTDVFLLARVNHTGTQLAATVSDFQSAVSNNVKLSGIEFGATSNSTDVFLLARANHTGNEPIAGLTNANSTMGGSNLVWNSVTEQFDVTVSTTPPPTNSTTIRFTLPLAIDRTLTLNTNDDFAIFVDSNFGGLGAKTARIGVSNSYISFNSQGGGGGNSTVAIGDSFADGNGSLIEIDDNSKTITFFVDSPGEFNFNGPLRFEDVSVLQDRFGVAAIIIKDRVLTGGVWRAFGTAISDDDIVNFGTMNAQGFLTNASTLQEVLDAGNITTTPIDFTSFSSPSGEFVIKIRESQSPRIGFDQAGILWDFASKVIILGDGFGDGNSTKIEIKDTLQDILLTGDTLGLSANMVIRKGVGAILLDPVNGILNDDSSDFIMWQVEGTATGGREIVSFATMDGQGFITSASKTNFISFLWDDIDLNGRANGPFVGGIKIRDTFTDRIVYMWEVPESINESVAATLDMTVFPQEGSFGVGNSNIVWKFDLRGTLNFGTLNGPVLSTVTVTNILIGATQFDANIQTFTIPASMLTNDYILIDLEHVEADVGSTINQDIGVQLTGEIHYEDN